MAYDYNFNDVVFPHEFKYMRIMGYQLGDDYDASDYLFRKVNESFNLCKSLGIVNTSHLNCGDSSSTLVTETSLLTLCDQVCKGMRLLADIPTKNKTVADIHGVLINLPEYLKNFETVNFDAYVQTLALPYEFNPNFKVLDDVLAHFLKGVLNLNVTNKEECQSFLSFWDKKFENYCETSDVFDNGSLAGYTVEKLYTLQKAIIAKPYMYLCTSFEVNPEFRGKGLARFFAKNLPYIIQSRFPVSIGFISYACVPHFIPNALAAMDASIKDIELFKASFESIKVKLCEIDIQFEHANSDNKGEEYKGIPEELDIFNHIKKLYHTLSGLGYVADESGVMQRSFWAYDIFPERYATITPCYIDEELVARLDEPYFSEYKTVWNLSNQSFGTNYTLDSTYTLGLVSDNCISRITDCLSDFTNYTETKNKVVANILNITPKRTFDHAYSVLSDSSLSASEKLNKLSTKMVASTLPTYLMLVPQCFMKIVIQRMRYADYPYSSIKGAAAYDGSLQFFPIDFSISKSVTREMHRLSEEFLHESEKENLSVDMIKELEKLSTIFNYVLAVASANNSGVTISTYLPKELVINAIDDPYGVMDDEDCDDEDCDDEDCDDGDCDDCDCDDCDCEDCDDEDCDDEDCDDYNAAKTQRIKAKNRAGIYCIIPNTTLFTLNEKPTGGTPDYYVHPDFEKWDIDLESVFKFADAAEDQQFNPSLDAINFFESQTKNSEDSQLNNVLLYYKALLKALHDTDAFTEKLCIITTLANGVSKVIPDNMVNHDTAKANEVCSSFKASVAMSCAFEEDYSDEDDVEDEDQS